VGHGLPEQFPTPEFEVEPRLKLVELALGLQLLLSLLSLAGLGAPSPRRRPGWFRGGAGG